MPYLKNGRGNWRIYRSFGYVGGIKVGTFDRPSGTKDRAVAEKIEEALDKVAQLGEHGAVLLCDIRDGKRTPLEVYDLFNRQQVKEIKVIRNADTLADAWETFVTTAVRKDGRPISDQTRKGYRKVIAALGPFKVDTTVAELPDLLRRYQRKCMDPKRKHYRSFNKTRAACLAFARNNQPDGQYSDLWREIAKINTAPSAPRLVNTALPVYEVLEVIAKLPEERMRNVAVALALTGMRVSEYIHGWTVKDDRVVIHGKKTVAAEREVPLLADLTPEPFYYFEFGRNAVRPSDSPLSYDHFCKALSKASDGKVSPNVLRHSYRLWMRYAGIDALRRNMYFGHKAKNLEEVYARHEMTLFLEEDTETLIAYIEKNRKRPKKEKKTVKRLTF